MGIAVLEGSPDGYLFPVYAGESGRKGVPVPFFSFEVYEAESLCLPVSLVDWDVDAAQGPEFGEELGYFIFSELGVKAPYKHLV